jgi:hypothetical protein
VFPKHVSSWSSYKKKKALNKNTKLPYENTTKFSLSILTLRVYEAFKNKISAITLLNPYVPCITAKMTQLS